MSKPQLFLIDGHALCYRAFYAIKSLTNSKGQATNAVYGFINALKKLMREYEPAYLAVCFDTKGPTLREQKFAEYKIQRPSMPEDLRSQIPIIKEIIKAYQIPIFEKEGYEADDLLATIAEKVQKQKVEVVIASDDKDMAQVVNDSIKIYHSRKDMIMGPPEIHERFGIPAELIPDWIGLVGDKSDNIPGVEGVGTVTACKLLNEYGSLDDVYDNIESISAKKVAEKLAKQKEQAYFSKELAVLDRESPIDIDLKELALGEPDTSRLSELFQELEFRKWAQELGTEQAPAIEVSVKEAKSKDIEKVVKKAKRVAILFAEKEEEQQCLLAAKDEVFALPIKDVKSLSLFEDDSITKVVYNIKDARKALAEYDVEIQGQIFDALLAGYLLTSGASPFTIEALAWNHLQQSIDGEDNDGLKAVVLDQLVDPMTKALKEQSLDKLFEEIELPLADVLYEMESNGVALDVKMLAKLSKECDEKITEITDSVYKLADEEFNLNSPKQLGVVLFEKLELPVLKKTKTGYSTKEEVLVQLARRHPLPQLVLEYRQLAKLKSTYIDALPQLVNEKTKRIHATFNQAGAETGRLSSNHPNLQNIPIRTELGRQIRKAFIVEKKDHVLLAVDYSQIELRILAHLAQDSGLMKAFQEDQDIHAYTAALVFEVKEDEVDARMRDMAKRVNFGIIYGMKAFGLAKDLEITMPEAQDFIDRYFLRYPNVQKFMQDHIELAQSQGYVTTILNRRRYIPEINSRNVGLRQFAERQAINTPVQGSAADLMKLAMIDVYNELRKKKLKAKMLITVHDELVLDVPEKELDQVTALVKDKMEHAFELSVPITVSVKVGKNWLEMKNI